MDVLLQKKLGHKFFKFTDDSVTRSVCVDGWINAKICPAFCTPVLKSGWVPLPDDRLLDVLDTGRFFQVNCPTSFGFVSSRGAFRKTGKYHMVLWLEKAGLSQFLYNYVS